MSGDERTDTAFAEALADLEERGSLLLLTGVDAAGRRAACQRLLGDPGAGPRRRLFVDVEGGTSVRSPDAHGGESRIRYRTSTRSAAAAEGSAAMEPTPETRPRVVQDGLPELSRAIETEAESLAGEDAPAGTVRLCLRGGDALVAAHDEERVTEFFRDLRDTAASVTGMFHVHLPGAYEDAVVRSLAPSFDAVVETRAGGQQRWHLRDPELTTAWLTL